MGPNGRPFGRVRRSRLPDDGRTLQRQCDLLIARTKIRQRQRATASFTLRDVQRNAARGADELVREGAIAAPDARNERAKGFDQFDAELSDDECHGVSSCKARTTADVPATPQARAGRVQARESASDRAKRGPGLEPDEHAGTIESGRR